MLHLIVSPEVFSCLENYCLLLKDKHSYVNLNVKFYWTSLSLVYSKIVGLDKWTPQSLPFLKDTIQCFSVQTSVNWYSVHFKLNEHFSSWNSANISSLWITFFMKKFLKRTFSRLNFSNSEREYKVDPNNLADLCLIKFMDCWKMSRLIIIPHSSSVILSVRQILKPCAAAK